MSYTAFSIDDALKQPLNTTILQLSRQHLNELPSTIGLLKNVNVLNLWLNNLTLLPNEIEELGYLLTIDISNNNFTSLPEILFSKKLVHLKNINARFLDLNELSPQIGQIQLLEYLDITGNKISSLPEEIGLLSNLKNLRLSQNNLTTLPDSLLNCTKLTTLHIRSNPLLDKEDIKSKVPETCVIVF